MNEDFKVIAFELTTNMEVELHSQEELEHLAKRRVIGKQCVNYNQQVLPHLCSSTIGSQISEWTAMRASRQG